MSFAAKILSEKSRVYCLQYDMGTKEECYFFLQVDAAKEAAFLRAIEHNAPNKIEEFGKVVASGWGAPGVGVREAMTAKFGVEFKDAS
jgi:hypothetical protein